MIKFDYNKVWQYEKDLKKWKRNDNNQVGLLLLGIMIMAISGGIGGACDDWRFVFGIALGVIVMFIPTWMYKDFPSYFHDYDAFYYLQKQKLEYLGYEFLKEDVVRIYYSFLDDEYFCEDNYIEYKLYDTISTDNKKVIYEIMTDETVMHEKNISQLMKWHRENVVSKEQEIYEKKVKELWSR